MGAKAGVGVRAGARIRAREIVGERMGILLLLMGALGRSLASSSLSLERELW